MGENKSNEAKETKQDQRRERIILLEARCPYTYSPCLQPHLPPKKRGKNV